MAETDAAPGDKIVVTLKGGAGFDVPWIVIHASSPEEAWDLLREIAPVEGSDNMTIGELTVAQAKNFQLAYGGGPKTSTAGSRTSGGRGSGSTNSGRSSGGGTSTRSSGRGGGAGGSRTMRSDQWPDHLNPDDFGECPKHGELIFKDEYHKDNGNKVSARITCSTPFCNAAPTYWGPEFDAS